MKRYVAVYAKELRGEAERLDEREFKAGSLQDAIDAARGWARDNRPDATLVDIHLDGAKVESVGLGEGETRS